MHAVSTAGLPPMRCCFWCRGFKLLAAMGYRQGQLIGKSGTGLAEPLPLALKQVPRLPAVPACLPCCLLL